MTFPRCWMLAERGAVHSAQVNVVVMRGVNDDELADFVELTRTLPINVRFIEYMPFDGNVWSDSKMVTYADMIAAVTAAYPSGLERSQVNLTDNVSSLCRNLLTISRHLGCFLPCNSERSVWVATHSVSIISLYTSTACVHCIGSLLCNRI